MAIVEMEQTKNETVKNKRLEMLKDDIRSILSGRVKYSEIVDAPYPMSTLREHLYTAIKLVCWEYKEENGLLGKCLDPRLLERSFTISSRMIYRKRHFYVAFDATAWDRDVELLRNA